MSEKENIKSKTSRGMVKKYITITQEQEEFLKKNESINLSGFVREKLNELMKNYNH